MEMRNASLEHRWWENKVKTSPCDDVNPLGIGRTALRATFITLQASDSHVSPSVMSRCVECTLSDLPNEVKITVDVRSESEALPPNVHYARVQVLNDF